MTPAAISLQVGETVTCTFENTKRGNIVINKINVGRAAAAQPTFTYFGSPALPEAVAGAFGIVNNAPVDFSLQTQGDSVCADSGVPNDQLPNFDFNNAPCKGTAIINNLLPGTQLVFEKQPNEDTWNLLNLVCVDPSGGTTEHINFSNVADQLGTPANGGRVSIDLAPGETVTCFFVNRFGGKIITVKQTIPDGSTQPFDFTTNMPNGFSDGTQALVLLDGESDESLWQPPNTYNVNETPVPAGWDFTSVACVVTAGPNVGSSVGNASGTGINVPISGGQVITCTFNNTERGRVIVEKDVSFGGVGGEDFPFTINGENGSDSFSLEDVPDDGVNNVFSGTNGVDLHTSVLPPGSYTLSELVDQVPPAGTWLVFGLSCQASGDNTSITGIGGGPIDTTGAFQEGDTDVAFVLGASGEIRCRYTHRLGGKVEITKQTLPDGFRLLSIICADSVSQGGQASAGDSLSRTATIKLDPGETVECKFVNTAIGEGCTPGYWKNHTDRWEGFSPSQTVASVFSRAGSAPYAELGNATLLQALSFRGGSTLQGAAGILQRAAVAAILNVSNPDFNYANTVNNTVTEVNAALDSQDRDAILALAGQLDEANNAICPLGGTPATRGSGSESSPRPSGGSKSRTSRKE